MKISYQQELRKYLQARKRFEEAEKEFNQFRASVSKDVLRFGNKTELADKLYMHRTTVYERIRYSDWTTEQIQTIENWFNGVDEKKKQVA